MLLNLRGVVNAELMGVMGAELDLLHGRAYLDLVANPDAH
jgi:hypothetical protein